MSFTNISPDDLRKRLFEVKHIYQYGEYSFAETVFYRGTSDALVWEVRGVLEDFSQGNACVTWSLDEQTATASCEWVEGGDDRCLRVTAREIASFLDLNYFDL